MYQVPNQLAYWSWVPVQSFVDAIDELRLSGTSNGGCGPLWISLHRDPKAVWQLERIGATKQPLDGNLS
jgi:hypothetical protein